MPAEQSRATADGPATFVNRFTLQTSPENFERVFAETSTFMAEQPGFVSFTLLRHLEEPDSYVNVAQWTDVEAFRAAVARPEFRPHAAALRAISSSESNLYLTRQSVQVSAP